MNYIKTPRIYCTRTDSGVLFMKDFKLYNDIKSRTKGEIYIGVVGPVRTGKSTFIRNFISQMIIPAMDDENEINRITDELPQAAAGRTVMTTEPKFIPKDGIRIDIGEEINVAFKLIDCVGYMVNGAQGIYEDEHERLVKTPWFEENIPFSKAAEYGTGKVIRDHSTIGVVVTTDGSIGELGRNSYLEAEQRTINELKGINKPFVILVNSKNTSSSMCKNTVKELHEKYNVETLAVDCENMTVDDINRILNSVLKEFPICAVEFYMPKWIELLDEEDEIKKDIILQAREVIQSIGSIKDIEQAKMNKSEHIGMLDYDKFDFTEGIQKITITVPEELYFEHVSEITGEKIEDEYELVSRLKEMSKMKKEYEKYVDVINIAKQKGYGVVLPDKEQIVLKEPEMIKTGNKYGVKIKAESPSVHMIKVNIATEISPIVGSEEQAKDLIGYINNSKADGDIWETNIFGKSVGQLIEDGIRGKMQMLNDDCQTKLQDTMQKVVNETNGGLVCLII